MDDHTEQKVPFSQQKESLMSNSTPGRWRWLAFAAALAATLMDLLDSTIATVAAPAIRTDLGGSYATCSGSRRPIRWRWR
jgi:hypothetical protein